MSKRRDERRIVSALSKESESHKTPSSIRKCLLALAGIAVMALVTVGVFAKNGWFPSTDQMTGKKTGWFGQPLARNTSSSWNPFAAVPTPTPKHYRLAADRSILVEFVV